MDSGRAIEHVKIHKNVMSVARLYKIPARDQNDPVKSQDIQQH